MAFICYVIPSLSKLSRVLLDTSVHLNSCITLGIGFMKLLESTTLNTLKYQTAILLLNNPMSLVYHRSTVDIILITVLILITNKNTYLASNIVSAHHGPCLNHYGTLRITKPY